MFILRKCSFLRCVKVGNGSGIPWAPSLKCLGLLMLLRFILFWGFFKTACDVGAFTVVVELSSQAESGLQMPIPFVLYKE